MERIPKRNIQGSRVWQPRWMLVLVLLFAGWLFAGAQPVCAMSAYIDAQPDTVDVGQSVEVTVVFSGGNVGRVRAVLEYDTSVLSYQGEEGDSGAISLSMAGTGGDIVYELPFKAVGAGSTALVMIPLDAYDLDEMSMSLPEEQSMTVTVKASEEVKPDNQKDSQDSASPEVKDPEKDDQESPEQDKDGRDKDKEPEKPSGLNQTVWILASAAGVLAVLLAVILVRRNKRD